MLKKIILLSLIIGLNTVKACSQDIGNTVNEKEYPHAEAVLPKTNEKADFVIEGSVEKNIDIAKKKIVQKEECYKTREKLETRLAALEKEIVKTGDRLNEQSVYVGGILAQIDTLGKSLSYNNSEEAKKMLENLEKEIEEILRTFDKAPSPSSENSVQSHFSAIGGIYD